MFLQWCGQACFLFTSEKGTKILTDPFNKHLGYSVPRYQVDSITVSHNHYDHNYIRAVPNHETIPIFREPGKYLVEEISILGLESFHDNKEGKERGKNTLFLFQIDGLSIAHLGDLGQILSSWQLKELGKVDILLVPIGGTYTLGAKEASLVVDQLKPSITIPMHYQTETLRYPLDPVEPFLKGKEKIEVVPDSRLELSLERLPKSPKIIVLDCF